MPQPIVITALSDPRVDVFRNVRDADMRGRDDLFMAESELVLRRLLQHPDRLHSLLLSAPKYERLRDVLTALPETVPVYVADLPLIHDIAAFHIHRGVLAAGRRPSAEALSLDRALGHLRGQSHLTLLLAEGITNVDNMGALFRNAAAFGVDGIVLDPNCCDPLYRKAIRVSMGHVLAIPYAVSRDWSHDLERLKAEWNLTLVAAESGARSVALWTMPAASRIGLVFGSEGQGLSQATLAHCDAVCQIPMAENVPSLNVAVASAVFLYELQRSAATKLASQENR
ncbi:MAG: RNA methyltransferase [Phycisphaerales bacterium]|nr:RNA methyltransferase [Phycisphaerales bacterium]MCI0629127.1 RNA methyltransferase [Phycisphaerales bacterium]MCI0676670.1 RNA methyltransferase [Phycisphaerales bacterium]